MHLLNAKELRDFLGVKTPEAAKKVATRLGVKPIFLGKGAGMGDRFIKNEVEEALLRLRDGEPKSKAATKKRPKPKLSGYFNGKYPGPPSKGLTGGERKQ